MRTVYLLCCTLAALQGSACFSAPQGQSAPHAAEAETAMVSRVGQSFNPTAVKTLYKVARHPSLAVPHMALENIAQLDFVALKVSKDCSHAAAIFLP